MRRRVWTTAEALLFEDTKTLQRVYAAQGFLRGYEYMHTRFYGALFLSLIGNQLYYFLRYPDYGKSLSDIFFGVFNKESGCGTIESIGEIDCSLANPVVWGPILALPVTWGLIKVFLRRNQARTVSPARLSALKRTVLRHRPQYWQDTGRWIMPRYPLQKELDLLVRSINWDGRILSKDRYSLFRALKQFTRRAERLSRVNGLHALAHVVEGVSTHDFPRLLAAGYSQEALSTLLRIKTEALAELERYVVRPKQREGVESDNSKVLIITPLSQLTAYYLLWTLGKPQAPWAHVAFWPFKGGKAYFKAAMLWALYKGISYAIGEMKEQYDCETTQGRVWQYLPWTGSYNCTVCYEWLSLGLGVSKAQIFDEQDCIDGLLSTPQTLDTLLNCLGDTTFHLERVQEMDFSQQI